MVENYTLWYRTGTLDLATYGDTASGHDTDWLTAGINPGDILILNGQDIYEILEVPGEKALKLRTPYQGEKLTKASYAIIRNFTSTSSPKLTALTAHLTAEFARRYDLDMQTITGKSAYECAVEAGYTGTEAQWAESLKAAGDWETAKTNAADARAKADEAKNKAEANASDITEINSGITVINSKISALEESTAWQGKYLDSIGARGGRNLGTHVTDEQKAAILAGNYSQFRVGDYWQGERMDLHQDGWYFVPVGKANYTSPVFVIVDIRPFYHGTDYPLWQNLPTGPSNRYPTVPAEYSHTGEAIPGGSWDSSIGHKSLGLCVWCPYIGDAPLHDKSTLDGGYAGCKWRTDHRETILPDIYRTIPEELIQIYIGKLSTGLNDEGFIGSWAWGSLSVEVPDLLFFGVDDNRNRNDPSKSIYHFGTPAFFKSHNKARDICMSIYGNSARVTQSPAPGGLFTSGWEPDARITSAHSTSGSHSGIGVFFFLGPQVLAPKAKDDEGGE